MSNITKLYLKEKFSLLNRCDEPGLKKIGIMSACVKQAYEFRPEEREVKYDKKKYLMKLEMKLKEQNNPL